MHKSTCVDPYAYLATSNTSLIEPSKLCMEGYWTATMRQYIEIL